MTYFVAPNGQQQGPYSLAQVEVMLNTGRLKPEDLCWSDGMDAWQPLSVALPSAVAAQRGDEEFNPYAPPISAREADPQKRLVKSYYGGIGRMAYFGISLLLGFTNVMILTAAAESLALTGLLILSTLGSVVAVYQRLKNIGQNPWWCIAALLPVVNLVIGFRCLACQEGYAEIRKLDLAGKIVAWIFGVILTLALLAILLG